MASAAYPGMGGDSCGVVFVSVSVCVWGGVCVPLKRQVAEKKDRGGALGRRGLFLFFLGIVVFVTTII